MVMSPSFSMKGWDLYYFVRDRRKSVLAAATIGVAFVISDNEVASIVAGILVEAAFSVAEFYVRKLKA